LIHFYKRSNLIVTSDIFVFYGCEVEMNW